MPRSKSIYTKKRQALVKAQAEVDGLVLGLKWTAERLQEWDRILMPEDTEQENGLQNLGGAIVLNPKLWPSFPDFCSLRGIWQNARQEAEDAFAALSDADKLEVDPLPQLPFQIRASRTAGPFYPKPHRRRIRKDSPRPLRRRP